MRLSDCILCDSIYCNLPGLLLQSASQRCPYHIIKQGILPDRHCALYLPEFHKLPLMNLIKPGCPTLKVFPSTRIIAQRTQDYA